MTGRALILALILLLAAMVCLAGCITPPTGDPQKAGGNAGSGGVQGGGGSGPAAPTPSLAPVGTGFITPATPFPVTTTPASGLSGTRLPDDTPVIPEYVAIYYNTVAFRNNATAFTYDLVRPPLVIEACLSPNMTSRTIWYVSKSGEKEERTETVTSISPNAWFGMKVRDPVTGQVIEEEGYSRGYGVETGKALTLRSPGRYLIEFSGNEIRAEIQIRVQKAEGQAGEEPRNMSCTF